MKKIYCCILLTALATFSACQRSTENRSTPKLRTHKVAADTLRAQQPVPEEESLPLRLRPVPADQAQLMFTSFDLSPLWLPDADGSPMAYNGFYGADHYRIELYFASVERDSVQSNLYHLLGKSRYKNNIIPFEGTLTLDSLSAFENLAGSSNNTSFTDCYLARGHFELREDTNYDNAGIFSGDVTLDFGLARSGEVNLWYYLDEAHQGPGFQFEGTWKSYTTGKTKPVLWAKDLFMIANSILEDFSIGEREVEINPKYRSLGWDKYWENEEWWSDTVREI